MSGGDAHAEVFLAAENPEEIGVADAAVVAPLLGEAEVGGAAAHADFAAVALEGRARDDIDNAADGVAVTVGRRGLNHLDVGDAVGDEVARIYRRVGILLAQKQSLPEILRQLGHVAEGVYTVREVHQLARRVNVDMPICEAVYRVLYEQLSAASAVKDLLNRATGPEFNSAP